MKFWLLATAPLWSRWEAIDEWTSVYDCTADHYRDLLGLAVTALVPALEMRFPDEGYMANYIMHGPPPLEESWFYRYTLDELPMAAELGYRILRVVAWESDAEHSFSEYLPGQLTVMVPETPRGTWISARRWGAKRGSAFSWNAHINSG